MVDSTDARSGDCTMNRRDFLQKTSLLGAAGLSLSFAYQDQPEPRQPDLPEPAGREEYRGPNVILVRFGGGVRRRETVEDAAHTYCPFIYHELGRGQSRLFVPAM